uniref:DUF6252 family protein n=1 Tax=Algibacter sp. AS12 TaxID=3135773 RepID=UPI00398B2F24
MVNGKAFVIPNTNNLVAIYQGGILQINGSISINDNDESILLSLSDPLKANKTYKFENNIYKAGYTKRDENTTCIYDSNKTYVGSINLTKIDRINYIVSGRFEFSTITDDCEEVKITNGRFDMNYTN